jgi:hypothetical protein
MEAQIYGSIPITTTNLVLSLTYFAGKTVIAISLIISNPAPIQRRIMPREHLWFLEKKQSIDHFDYVPPPAVDMSGRKHLLSNGTLIVLPMTILSQW